MLHSHIKIFLHIVWSTKDRQPLLNRNARSSIQEHLLKNAIENGIAIDAIAVQPDHVHLLLAYKSDQKLEQIMQLIKGESSHWANSQNLLEGKFAWQRGYGAFSVSQSHVERVKEYIRTQDEHHRTKSFGEEYAAILRKYGFAANETDESVSE